MGNAVARPSPQPVAGISTSMTGKQAGTSREMGAGNATAVNPAMATASMTATNATMSWAAGVMMNGTFITQTQSQFNQTVMLINDLLLSKTQALRTMHVSLGAFSLALGLMMIVRIINDARKTRKLQVSLRPKRFDIFMNVHPAETFPLALGGAIVVQQLVFVTVQSTALNSVLVSGCEGLAQIIFPSLFILGYTTLVFGFETMVRSLKRNRFRPRGKWNTPICIISVAAMMLFTWIPTAVWRGPNRCFGSLVWFPITFSIVAVGIMSFLLLMYLLMGAIITWRLMGPYKLDHDERVSASRICYYIIFTTILYALVLPFFIEAYMRDFARGLTTSRLSEIALFSSGIFVAFIHLFLRVNASRLVIKPRGASSAKRPRIRFFGPSDLTISGPMIPQDPYRDDVALAPEKEPFPDANNFYSPQEKSAAAGEQPRSPLDPSRWPLPPNPMLSPLLKTPQTTSQTPDTPAAQQRQRSRSNYSLFPTRAEDVPRLPATIYTPPGSKKEEEEERSAVERRATQASEAVSVTDVSEAYLFPPSAPFTSNRHRRDSSSGSSATVQIGLRLSVTPATIAAGNASAASRMVGAQSPPPLPALLPAPPIRPPARALRRDNSDSSGESLGLPIQKMSSAESSISSGEPSPQQMPKPLVVSSKATPKPKMPMGLPSGPKVTPDNDPSKYLQEARNKMLPIPPRVTAAAKSSTPPPSVSPPAPRQISGLRMNPVTPPRTAAGTSVTRSPPPNSGPNPGWI